MNERMRMYLRSQGETRNTYNGGDMGYEDRYEMENRRGRDGRYMPKNEMSYEMRGSYNSEYNNEYRGGGGSYRNEERMAYPRRIGFSMDEEQFPREMDREYRSNYEYNPRDEMRRGGGGHYQMGKGESNALPKFNRRMAEEWVENMEGEDGAKGEKFSLEHARKIMEERGIHCDPYEFWAVLNAVHSDYGKVFSKFGIGNNLDFLAEMAKAWICDKDAVEDKASAYFIYVVK